MTRPANPDDYYSLEADSRGVAGSVLLDAKIWSDGRTHDPRAEYSIPKRVFESAGLAVAFATGFSPAVENGTAVSCTMRFKVKFGVFSAYQTDALEENVDEIRAGAERGDARSQLLYALFLENRFGLKPSGEDALSWFVKAAQAGLPIAQFKVGYYALNVPADKDDAKAAFWLEKAAGAGVLDAQLALSNYYLRDMSNSVDVGKAVALMETVSGRSLDARFHLAAIRATSPDVSIRDPKRALALAESGFSSYEMSPIAFEIRAAIHAALNDFAGAQKDQARAVNMAKKLRWNTAPQQARLEVYKANKAWTGDLFAFY
jgi:TPR repeat protein